MNIEVTLFTDLTPSKNKYIISLSYLLNKEKIKI